jgi:hypothetical protein
MIIKNIFTEVIFTKGNFTKVTCTDARNEKESVLRTKFSDSIGVILILR